MQGEEQHTSKTSNIIRHSSNREQQIHDKCYCTVEVLLRHEAMQSRMKISPMGKKCQIDKENKIWAMQVKANTYINLHIILPGVFKNLVRLFGLALMTESAVKLKLL